MQAGTGLLSLQKAAQVRQCFPEAARVTAGQSLLAPLCTPPHPFPFCHGQRKNPSNFPSVVALTEIVGINPLCSAHPLLFCIPITLL